MKRFAMGSVLLLMFLLSSPAAQACYYLCTEVYENCFQCVFSPDDPWAGCYQVSQCHCRDEQCAPQQAASTPEAFGIFAPTPTGVPMSVARPGATPY